MEIVSKTLDKNLTTSTSEIISSEVHHGDEEQPFAFTASAVLTTVALIIVIFVTVLGNVLILVTIATDKNLRSHKSNYLLFSLAAADLFVGVLVMPLGAVQIITRKWIFDATWCEIWTFAAIFSCSSSILHLLSIAIDRYLSVSLQRLKWDAKRNSRSIYIMIGGSWLIAAIVAICPVLGWIDDDFLVRIAEKSCVVSQSLSFLFFGITLTYYIPLLFLVIFYWRTWLYVRRKETQRKEQEISELRIPQDLDAKDLNQSDFSIDGASVLSNADAKSVVDSQRIARTLTIITGTFVICHSPYFLTLPIDVLCRSCGVHQSWIDFAQWLGFTNSMLNPIIYTIFSTDFRSAFLNLLKKLKFR